MALVVKLTKQAFDFLNDLGNRKMREAIKEHITQLSINPTAYPLSKPLRGRAERCCRVGDYRILFLIEPKKGEEVEDTLLIATIGHRKDVYE